MSKYSVIVNGVSFDYGFKKLSEICYAFYVGSTLVGQLFKFSKNNWSDVSWKTPSKLCPVDGFRTRLSAAQFLLKLNGYPS